MHVRLYHVTDQAEQILSEGFRDGVGKYGTDADLRGVFLSDQPLDANEGAVGNDMLIVEIPVSLVGEFELVEEGKTYREFLVPASVLHAHAQVTKPPD
jgi:hypothetical protein